MGTPMKFVISHRTYKSPVQKLDFREIQRRRDSVEDDVDSSFNSLNSSTTTTCSKDMSIDFSLDDEGWDPSFATPQHSPVAHRRNVLNQRYRDQSPVSVSRGSSSPESPMLFNRNLRLQNNNKLRNNNTATSTASPPGTPPHKRLRNLRLFDTPHTPKSLLQSQRSSGQKKSRSAAGRLFDGSGNDTRTEPPVVPCTPATENTIIRRPVSRIGSSNKKRTKLSNNVANVNPFTPSALEHLNGVSSLLGLGSGAGSSMGKKRLRNQQNDRWVSF